MSKRLTLLVDSCRECPFAIPPVYADSAPWYCLDFRADILNINKLPPWCPLSDWSEVDGRTAYKKIRNRDTVVFEVIEGGKNE